MQYYGFMGFVFFYAENAEELPWNTTKRDIDDASPVYRRAVAKMRELTRAFCDYTNQRKGDPEAAKSDERGLVATPVTTANAGGATRPLKLPKVRNRGDFVSIQYRKPRKQVQQVAQALGDASLSATTVGSKTFDYFFDREEME